MSEQPHDESGDAAGWDRLESLLRQVLAAEAARARPGDVGVDVPRLLQEAYLLVTDSRADVASLTALAARGAYRSWAMLTRTGLGTAARTAAVLDGWEDAGSPVAGRRGATAPPFSGDWTGRSVQAPAEVFAVWHVSDARTARLSQQEVYRLALTGGITPDNAPEPDDEPDED